MHNFKAISKKLQQKGNSRVLLNPCLNGGVSLSQPEHNEKHNLLYTDSPYAKVISRIRSHSQLKQKAASYQVSGVASPIYNSSPSNQPTLSKKLPYKPAKKERTPSLSELKKVQHHSNKKHSISKDFSIKESFSNLEPIDASYIPRISKKLNELKKLHKEINLTFEVFESYQALFLDIILKDKIFGPCLQKIKEAYEEWIKTKVGFVSENTQLKSEIALLNDSLKSLRKQNEKLISSVKKLSEEGVKLGRDNELKDKQYRCLQEHLVKISNIKRDDYPQTEEAWKLVIAENRTYSEICECMKVDIKNLKENERRLLALIDYFRDDGHPVDEIYMQLMKQSPSAEEKSEIAQAASEDEEYLVSLPLRSLKKRTEVPNLDLGPMKNTCVSQNGESESIYSLTEDEP